MFTKKSMLSIAFIIFLAFITLPCFSQNSMEFELKYFVDDFGDPTQEMYLSKEVQGVFSNSATTNSDLVVRIVISKNEIGFVFYEYGNSLVKEKDTNYTIRIKADNSQIYTLYADSLEDIGRISVFRMLYSLDPTNFFNDRTSKFFIYQTERKVTNYSFSCALPTLEYIRSKLGNEIFWLPN